MAPASSSCGHARVPAERRTPCGHEVPARAAARGRVRGEHLDAGRREVVPVRDPGGVAGTDVEDDDRGGHHPAVGRVGPVVRDQSGVGDLVDVRTERECDDVGLVARDHVGRLRRGRAVGLLEDHVLAVVVFLPLVTEGRDDLAVDLARRAVRREADHGGVGDVRCSPPPRPRGSNRTRTARGRARGRARPVGGAWNGGTSWLLSIGPGCETPTGLLWVGLRWSGQPKGHARVCGRNRSPEVRSSGMCPAWIPPREGWCQTSGPR